MNKDSICFEGKVGGDLTGYGKADREAGLAVLDQKHLEPDLAVTSANWPIVSLALDVSQQDQQGAERGMMGLLTLPESACAQMQSALGG